MKFSHGGDIYRASETYGISSKELIDYSSNINPQGLPNEMRNIIINNIDTLAAYPDSFCSGLRKDISKYLDVSYDSIIVGNGAVEVIFLYLDTLRPEKVLIPVPTFSEYERSCRVMGLDVEYLELQEKSGFVIDLESIASKLTGGIQAMFLCNPNNPTSTLLSKASLLKVLDYTSQKNIKMIVDETFIELTLEGNKNSLSEYVKHYNNLFIVRAFTKIFSMPGLRLGYGIGDQHIIKKMWDRKMPWSVNSFASMAGPVLSLGTKYLQKTSQWLKNELEWFYRKLNEIHHIKVFKPHTNFILVKILSEKLNSGILKDEMAKRGILIRDASNFRGLDDKYVRIAVKDRESNLRFLEVLKEVLR